jgi:hypothetical protein
MTNRPTNTKSELLASIEPAWKALTTALGRLTESQKTTIKDPQGWAVKDHLGHLAAWERSVVFFLQGQPRHAGLGVDRALYKNGNFDEINAVIFQHNQGVSLGEAEAQLNQVYQQLLELLQPLTDADLLKPYVAYLPDERGDERLAMDVIYDNTTSHYQEHQGWIEALVRDH